MEAHHQLTGQPAAASQVAVGSNYYVHTTSASSAPTIAHDCYMADSNRLSPWTEVAVVGGGVSGLTAAYCLSRDPRVRVTLYEERDRLGGHANTVLVSGFGDM